MITLYMVQITLVETVNNYCICGLEHMKRRVPVSATMGVGEESDLSLELLGHITRATSLLQTLQYPQEHTAWVQSLLLKLQSLREKITASLEADDKQREGNVRTIHSGMMEHREDDFSPTKKKKKILRVKKKPVPPY